MGMQSSEVVTAPIIAPFLPERWSRPARACGLKQRVKRGVACYRRACPRGRVD